MDVITHKCPNCGGALTFEPSDQKFHCPFCLSIFTTDELSAFEEKQKASQLVDETTSDQASDTQKTDSEQQEPDANQMELYTCPSCGAEIVTDATTAATYCYFCHNPVVLTGRLSGKFLPSRVLPFAINKEKATQTFLQWAQKKWFVPKDFFNQAQVEKLTGVYFPYWAVSADAKGQLNGVGTSLRVWVLGDIEYTETKEYAVRRAGNLHFRDFIQNALSKNAQKKMVEGVQPFPLEKAVAFENQYLSGFQAEKRDIEYLDIQSSVHQELTDYGQSLLSDTVNGYTTFRTTNKQLSITKEDNQYVLLPVWLVTYQANDDKKKTFYYAMNGQTGKTSGILPLSYGKLAAFCGSIFAVIAIILMIGGYFL
ncbi:TFIIB-type zinc ribbon-containing protein [Enterococcus italicus]|uniref:TFIIB-type zinc ribbon-containing protein n=1 Tax=Enterococcus italicus TaxID=246144 RepID=UPI0028B1FE78|nr:TFIIB-type zinc ribbon-containing protein [Enterococcus italicus]